MTLGISKNRLSLGMQGDDVARVQQALQALGRKIPRGESANRIMGTGTVALLKALQADLGLPATGVVDPETVKGINLKLGGRDTDQRVVRGSVRDPNGQPFPKAWCRSSVRGRMVNGLLGNHRWGQMGLTKSLTDRRLRAMGVSTCELLSWMTTAPSKQLRAARACSQMPGRWRSSTSC